MRTFQIVLLSIFGFFILAGVIAIATFGKIGGGGSDVPAVASVWGTISSEVVNDVVAEYNEDNDNVLQVTYTELDEGGFNSKLINALAAGAGPDAIIFPAHDLAGYEDKIYPIPYDSISERVYRDTYIEGAELFLRNDGILALPIIVDPLVMYWNRTLFNGARIPLPPKHWDELVDLSKSLTKTDESFNILQSVVALGEYRNVSHAKEILTTLIMQAGNPITIRDAGGRVGAVLNEDFGLPEAPADSALRFYTEFANPVKPVYSWNRSLPQSVDMFVRGDVALYLGFGSELFRLQERNPNLNFDMAPIPQIRESTLKTTFGNIYALALMKQSKNIAGAFRVVTILASRDADALWAEKSALPPVRRDLLAAPSASDPYQSILYKEALVAGGFIDPDPAETATIFLSLVENITSGRMPVSRAVAEANAGLDRLLR